MRNPFKREDPVNLGFDTNRKNEVDQKIEQAAKDAPLDLKPLSQEAQQHEKNIKDSASGYANDRFTTIGKYAGMERDSNSGNAPESDIGKYLELGNVRANKDYFIGLNIDGRKQMREAAGQLPIFMEKIGHPVTEKSRALLDKWSDKIPVVSTVKKWTKKGMELYKKFTAHIGEVERVKSDADGAEKKGDALTEQQKELGEIKAARDGYTEEVKKNFDKDLLYYFKSEAASHGLDPIVQARVASEIGEGLLTPQSVELISGFMAETDRRMFQNHVLYKPGNKEFVDEFRVLFYKIYVPGTTTRKFKEYGSPHNLEARMYYFFENNSLSLNPEDDSVVKQVLELGNMTEENTELVRKALEASFRKIQMKQMSNPTAKGSASAREVGLLLREFNIKYPAIFDERNAA